MMTIVLGSAAVLKPMHKRVVSNFSAPADTGKKEKPRFPGTDNNYDPTDIDPPQNLQLKDPANLKTDIEYDFKTGNYEFEQKMGGVNYRNPSYMTFKEYLDYDMSKQIDNYWKQRHEAEQVNASKGLIPKILINNEAFDRIFGGNTVDIRPQGAAELIFGVNTSRTENPAIAENQRKISTFDFNQKIQINLLGKIGDKLKVTTNYNTEAAFDFENQMKLEYTGYEDEILQKIEAGNVNLPLTGSLITGSQSLFGLKAQMRFGKTNVTTVFSEQRGKKQEVNVQGGAQIQRFEVTGDNYEANRHYFLAHYFRDRYDSAMANLPLITSNVNITKIEVWITNISGAVDNTRNILALTDLGEARRTSDPANPANQNQTWYADQFIDPPIGGSIIPYPDNARSNNLYAKLTTPGAFDSIRNIFQAPNLLAIYNTGFNPVFSPVRDYEILENSKRLQPSEYNFNPRLGFLSLNQALNNGEVLAVAYQYTVGTETYQVGEFSTDGIAAPRALFVKLLKPSNVRVKLPIWDLMMKNVYSIGGYNIDVKDFKLDIFHANLQKGVDLNYIPEGSVNKKVLIQVMGMDKINNQLERIPDGYFDFIDGVTINKSNGRVYFPVVEPFGSYLRGQFASSEQAIANKYVFQELYDSTKTAAQQIPSKNRFKIRGQYSSASGSDIALNATNIPQGSVTVTAGGAVLQENVDYTVDYSLGRLKIINEGVLASNQPVKVQLESQSLFNIQRRRMLGLHFDHKVNKDFTFGGTIMNLSERPLTQKVNMGDEPINNTIWGLDANYKTEVPWLTTLVDKIPFIDTKEKSTLSLQGEFAHLIPGHNRAVTREGNSYIDDFEGSQALIDIKAVQNWSIASIPQGQPDLFPEATLNNDLRVGNNRAKLSWYVIDPLFFRSNSLTPDHIRNDLVAQSNHFTREILETEIFPNRTPQNPQITNLPVLDLAFYPNERGPYNYDVNPGTFSAGLNIDGKLSAPSTRWGGMMRKIDNNDFETTNIEYIQFWLMDPYNEDNPTPNTTGALYINLGDISEDILKDSRKSFENGLPISDNIPDPNLFDSTKYGLIPVVQQVVNAFDNNPDSRRFQDVGMDGLSNEDERTFFDTAYVSKVVTKFAGTNPAAPAILNAQSDPSADDFKYFRSNTFDAAETPILERYKEFRGLEGNSSIEQPDGYPITSTTLPNVEDINRDNNLTYNEAYYQYKIKIDPNSMQVGQNYITDVLTTNVQTRNGTRSIKWYQFKVPLRNPERVVGGIADFRSIRFMRMFLKGFDQPIICRLGRLDLIRGDWRKYLFDLRYPGEYIQQDDQSQTEFEVAAVNIEENGNRIPINYVVPPGIRRVIDQSTTNLRQLNEQSLVLKVCNLQDGFSKAAYKTMSIDVRRYKRLKMFVHLEARGEEAALKKEDLRFFMRIGTDFDQNYYEYEMPVVPSAWNNNEPNAIWPTENDLEVVFKTLTDAKVKRNFATSDINTPFRTRDSASTYPDRYITVVGNPNLAAVKTIMVGIRNPKKNTPGDADDGLPKCAEMWVNELRLTDFDQKGGYAATARLQAKLADFADVSAAGNWRTQGFGGVEQKILERSMDNLLSYEVSSTVKLQKFFPEAYNISLPMYVSLSETFVNPQWNPLDPDVSMKDYKSNYGADPERRDSIVSITRDYTKRRSINFTNVKKNKAKGKTKSHIYDIENFSVSYAYSEIYRTSFLIEADSTINYRAGLAYNFNNNPKNYKPLSKVKFLKNEVFKIITDFNFNLMPSRIGVRTDFDRMYNVNKPRNTTPNSDIIIQRNYNKLFTNVRNFDFKYDLSKAISFDFSATTNARIDEIQGKRWKDFKGPNDADTIKVIRDSLNSSLRNFGRITNYHQTANLNWNLPINKLPYLNWITATAKYSGNYDWIAATPAPAEFNLGNNIINSNNQQINTNVNMVTLYNRIQYFKNILSGKKGGAKEPPKNDSKGKATDKKVEDKNNKAKEDTAKKNNIFLETLARLVMTIRTGSASYTKTEGTNLPGFLPTTKYLGMADNSGNTRLAPGLGFVFGAQDPAFLSTARANGWISQNENLNTTFTNSSSENLTARVNLEPFKDLKIELNATRSSSLNKSGIYRYSPNDENADQYGFITQSPMETGNHSISIITWKTAFKRFDKNTYASETFETFRQNRKTVSEILGTTPGNFSEGVDSGGFYDGYGPNAQEVLIPAFIAAYTGKSVNEVGTSQFPSIPLPNWRVTYDGLTKIDKIKKHFKSFTLSHAYRSTYNVGAFTTNQFFKDSLNEGFTGRRDFNDNFRPQKEIQIVTISEQFSPLLLLDMTWTNSLITKIELKRERNLSMSLTNAQLTEMRTNEIVTGLGYRFKDVVPPFAKKFKFKVKSDLNLRADISFRRNQTLIRKVVENLTQPTAGQNVISIKVSADYIINEKLNLRIFYDRIITTPLVSTTFPTSNTNSGISLRFTIAQ
ncbi:MAG: cell surface protein SprA [Bacteroidota bacterium]